MENLKLYNDRSKEKVKEVNKYEFEPIKGYPMLNWKGKRPFTNTQYYPAQLKEKFGEENENWINKIFWGDNLQVMSHLLKEYRGKIKLIYIDPPFDSKADYKKKIKLKTKEIINDNTAFEEKQYSDIWNNDEYLQFMYERLILMRELLSNDGSIYLHCDWHKSHLIRCILDEVFGKDLFLNEIVWNYGTYIGQTKRNFPRKHDTIFIYTKSKDYTFNMLRDNDLDSDANYKRWKKYFNNENQICGNNYPKDDSKFSGYIKRFQKEKGRLPEYEDDIILEISGKVIDDVWYIQSVNPFANERVGYPTQKPEELIERIIMASSNSNDIVFDCFMGSGTTQAVAMKLGRKFIGADINLGAVQTTTKRLLNLRNKLNNIDNYLGFEVYNVNNYDLFRNPTQAKELLIEALEIQKLDRNTVFDGEKDGKMVKIMPINRITTKADLTEIISNLDFKLYEERATESPGRAVEDIMLVCMGHESDIAANLKKEIPFKIEIEVVDILRDKNELEFKRDSEAEIKIKDGELVIEKFYPMNLLEKLSQDREYIEDWKYLVESIFIDWNYDGVTLEPIELDIPEKNELVKGKYKIPEDAGTIMIKITDLLSESLEVEVQNG